MKIKAIAVSLYIGFIYWIASRYGEVHTLFFPTLGAFAYLFILRNTGAREMGRIVLGALLCAACGTLFSALHPHALFFVLNMLAVFWLMHRLKWNAPPLMAVAFIPFFVHSAHAWTIPLSVICALAGLSLTLLAAAYVQRLGERYAARAADSSLSLGE